MRLERLRGFLAQSAEHFQDAMTSYERIVAAAPNDWETWNNLGNARRGCGRFAGHARSVAARR